MSRFRRAMAVAIASAAFVAVAPGTAFGKITEEPISCTNPSGKQPGGQQPECKGGAHDQETENQNPSGKAPPGHNK